MHMGGCMRNVSLDRHIPSLDLYSATPPTCFFIAVLDDMP